MADSNQSGTIARATKPVSEALLNEKVRASLGFRMDEIVADDTLHKICDN
jgi:hypothetical protein